jgi:hypothetical protein
MSESCPEQRAKRKEFLVPPASHSFRASSGAVRWWAKPVKDGRPTVCLKRAKSKKQMFWTPTATQRAKSKKCFGHPPVALFQSPQSGPVALFQSPPQEVAVRWCSFRPCTSSLIPSQSFLCHSCFHRSYTQETSGCQPLTNQSLFILM